MNQEYIPKISVAMACYNSAKYLKAAIKSILRQTYTNWEIVFVEDMSTDNTAHLLKKYIVKYSLKEKEIVIRHNENLGYGTSLHDAIKYGTGELVAVVDSDDALAGKYAFAKMVEAHRTHPDASLCYSTYYFCRNKLSTRFVKDVIPIPAGQTYLYTLLNPGTRGNGKGLYHRVSHLKVFKRACYDRTEGLMRGLRKAVDRDLVLKLEEVGQLIFINEPLYIHRKHDGNITNLWGEMSKAERAEIIAAKKQIIRNAQVRRGMV
jgi:glycosyltransferase involved in cell wall biosynthesis